VEDAAAPRGGIPARVRRSLPRPDITTARGTEMMLPIWVRVWGATKNPMFSFKLVR
jgi:hypothetical protein